MKRLYLIPARDACNSDCSFCYMKEREPDLSKPQFIDADKMEKIIDGVRGQIGEVEITGGGEPLLHPRLGEIISAFGKRNIYVKLYTNGFLLKDLPRVEEVNISRVHWDSKINNRFYRSPHQNELREVLNHYKSLAKKIRMQIILMKGAIDCQSKALEFIRRYEDRVDIFMFRTLFPKCSLEKDKFVDYFAINHPQAKIDRTLDSYDRELLFLDSGCALSDKFDYGQPRVRP